MKLRKTLIASLLLLSLAGCMTSEQEPQSAEILQEATQQSEITTCSLGVFCTTAVGVAEMDLPADGILFSAENIAFEEGESAFIVLQRTLQEAGIPMEFSKTTGSNSCYLKGIGGLYEMDCGPLSGWLYLVNGAFPLEDCGSYLLQDGDVISLHYTCAMGEDIGLEVASEG